MKSLLTGLALVLVSACGGATSPRAEQAMGIASFKVDQVSCVYSGARSVTFYIANLDVGTESLLSGATSVGYPTKASSAYATTGNPVVQAMVANYTATGGALWTLRTNIVVPANGATTHTFTC